MSQLPAVNPSELGKALTGGSQRMAQDAGDLSFLRLIKGEWVFSADDIEVQEGSLWAVNPASFTEGYVAWGDGELAGEEMRLMSAGNPVLASELRTLEPGEAKQGWQKQFGFQLVCLNGEDAGTEVMFKTSSKGGLKAGKAILNEVIGQITADPLNIVAVVELLAESYKHKTWGKIYNPIFDIKDWTDFEAAVVVDDEDDGAGQEVAAEEPSPPPEPAPKKRARRRPLAK